MYTMQSWFDEAVSYLRAMPKQASRVADINNREVTACMYLTPDGSRCVVGHFIPEGHPGELHSFGVISLSEEFPSLCGLAWPVTTDPYRGVCMASDMQAVHDEDSNWDEAGFIGWDDIALIADKFGLEYIDTKDLALVSV